MVLARMTEYKKVIAECGCCSYVVMRYDEMSYDEMVII